MIFETPVIGTRPIIGTFVKTALWATSGVMYSFMVFEPTSHCTHSLNEAIWLGLRWFSTVSVCKVKWLCSSQLTKSIAVDEFKCYLELTFHVFLFLPLMGALLIFQLLLSSIATLTSCKVLKSLKSTFPEYEAKSVKYVMSKLSKLFQLDRQSWLG